MEHRRPSLIGPLILITIGVLFLLANLGMLPYSFWEIAARFWPLVLILVGLEIIFGRRSPAGALVVILLWVALVGGVLWLAAGGLLPSPTVTTESLSQPMGNITNASLDLNAGIAATYVTALSSDSGDLMSGTFAHSQGSRMVQTFDVVGDEGRLSLAEQGADVFMFNLEESRWDIGLNPRIPLALSVNGGVGRVILDLSGLKVTSLSINAGVGLMSVVAPKTGMSTLSVDGGVGSVAVTIPAGVAARIQVSSGLGGIDVNAARFPRFGDVYQTADYASATNRIDISVDGGVGTIRIQ
ncbi:MAG: cell wall-active antibiotics response protein [Chloroflexi bacterium]|nr:cell wall-active antibiotics response protein [Chloroflexota bacterium]